MKKYIASVFLICSQFFLGCNYDSGMGPGFPEQMMYSSTVVNGKKSVDEMYSGLYLEFVRNGSADKRKIELTKNYYDPPSYVLLECTVLEHLITSRNHYKADMLGKDGKYYKVRWFYKRNYAELQFSGPYENLYEEIGGNYLVFKRDN